MRRRRPLILGHWRFVRIVTIPRHNPVYAYTMGGIARDAGRSAFCRGPRRRTAQKNANTCIIWAAVQTAQRLPHSLDISGVAVWVLLEEKLQ